MLFKVKRFFRNLIDWMPILIRDEQWDFEFMERVILHKLKLMLEFYESDKVHADPEKAIEGLKFSIDTLERIIEDDYIHFPEGKEPAFVEKNRGDGLTELKLEYKPGFGEKRVSEVYDKSDRDRKKDREIFYESLRDRSPEWWD